MDMQTGEPEPSITTRINAILEFDGIQPERRASYLAQKCGISRATAKRLLSGVNTMRMGTYIKVVQALDVDFRWILDGKITEYHIRTWRIYVQVFKGYPPNVAANIVKMFSASVMGHSRARNLLDMAAAGSLSFTQAARLI